MSDDPFGDSLAQAKQQATQQVVPPAPAQSDDPFGDSLAQAKQQEAEQAQQEGQAPTWSQIPGRALTNLPNSAGQFISNTYQAFRHPFNTAEAIGNVGHGLAQSLGVAPEGGHEDEKYWNAVKDEFKGRYGSIDNFKKALADDPVGTAGDISMLFGGVGLAERAPGLAGKVAGIVGKVGRVVDPLAGPAAVVKGAAGVGRSALYGLGNIGTHSGQIPLEEAAKAGYEGGEANRAFNESAKGITTPEEIVDNAQRGVDNMARERGLNYNQSKAVWSQSQTPLPWTDINGALNAGIKEFHGRDLLSPRGKAMRARLDDVISDWKSYPPNPYHTAAGFDAMKQEIGELRDQYASDPLSPEYKVAHSYYKAIGDTIKNHVPEYAGAMDDYRDATQAITDMRKTLSLPYDQQKGTIDSALRKLTSTQRKNVNTNFGQRARLVDELERQGSTNLKPQLAGQALSSREPHGMARILPSFLAGTGHWGEALASAFTTPYRVGQVANKLGSVPRLTGHKFVAQNIARNPIRQSLGAAQQVGRNTPDNGDRLYVSPNREARGGKVERALRVAKKR